METIVHINKKNNVYATLHSEDAGFLMSIYEHFSRYVDGYIFHPKFKARLWDGKIRFFNRATGEIYLGLVNRVIQFCKDEGVKVKLDKKIIASFTDLDFNEAHFNSFMDNLNATNGKGEPMTPYDYQVHAVKSIVERKRRMIASPTSSGKSFIMYAASRYLLEHKFDEDEQILIIVPTIALIKQMKTDFGDYSIANKWDWQRNVSEYGAGKKDLYGKVVVATWQSLFRKDPSFFSRFRMILVDEAHQATAKSLVDIGKMCDAEYRIGLSGSFDDSDETTEMSLNGLFANKTVTTTTKKMIENGQAAKLEIKCVRIKHKGFTSRLTYQAEKDYLSAHPERNRFIVDLADGLEGNTLILFDLVEKQGKPLFELAKKYSQKKVYFIYGGVDVDDREKIRKTLEKEKGAILIASYKTFSTGNNVKNLENIIFGSPTKSFSRVIQSIGRGLRLNEGKTKCMLFDIFDWLCGDLKDLKSCNVTLEHFTERLKIYRKEEHPFEIEPANIGI